MLTTAPDVFNFPHAAHDDATHPAPINVEKVSPIDDHARRWKRRPDDVRHQIFDRRVGLGNKVLRGGDYLGRIMGRQVRRQTHRNAVGTVNQCIGKFGGQHDWFAGGPFVILDHGHRALINIAQEKHARPAQSRFGVTRRSGAEIRRAVVAVKIEQWHQV